MPRQTVLLVGATGMFGSRIARHLLDQPEAEIRLLARSSEGADRKAALSPLLDRGAEIVEGDLADRASLDRATQGVDVIVSAVQGGPEVLIDGQSRSPRPAARTACAGSSLRTTRSTCSRRRPAST